MFVIKLPPFPACFSLCTSLWCSDEDEDGDRIAIRSDDDMSAFVTFLEKEQAAIIWLGEVVTSSSMWCILKEI